jgi:hypothetical protein
MSKIKTVLVAVLGVACVLGAAGCSSSRTSRGGSTPTTHEVSTGVAAHAAAKDVKVGRWHQPSSAVSPVVTVKVVITNSSSKRSDYIVDLALESADGTMEYETTPVVVDGLEAGRTTTRTASFVSVNVKLPKTAKVVMKSVERTSSV